MNDLEGLDINPIGYKLEYGTYGTICKIYYYSTNSLASVVFNAHFTHVNPALI